MKQNASIGYPNWLCWTVSTEPRILLINECTDFSPCDLIKMITQHFLLICYIWTKRYADSIVRCSTLNKTMHLKNTGLIHERCRFSGSIKNSYLKIHYFLKRIPWLKEVTSWKWANLGHNKLGILLVLVPIKGNSCFSWMNCHALHHLAKS